MVQYNQVTASILITICAFSSLVNTLQLRDGSGSAPVLAGTCSSAITMAVAAFFAWKNRNPSTVAWMFGVVAALGTLALVVGMIFDAGNVQTVPSNAEMIVVEERNT